MTKQTQEPGLFIGIDWADQKHDIYVIDRNGKIVARKLGAMSKAEMEAAIKLARKITQKTNVISFTNGSHGCSLGSLSLTGSAYHRQSSSSSLGQATRAFYDGYLGENINTISVLETLLNDQSSGIDKPAAIIVESIQGEGGLNTASAEWLVDLYKLTRRHDILFILDDIQAGCGRSGTFFSVDQIGFQPDMITLAKSISGFGLPMAVLLIKPDLDIWQPGEHNGTFRGNNHAFVTVSVMLEKFWANDTFQKQLFDKSNHLKERLTYIASRCGYQVKGRGFILGIDTKDREYAARVRRSCFESGVILELSGPQDEVIKLMPALSIDNDLLDGGIDVVESALKN